VGERWKKQSGVNFDVYPPVDPTTGIRSAKSWMRVSSPTSDSLSTINRLSSPLCMGAAVKHFTYTVRPQSLAEGT
jgi:hypothetical protein